MPLSARSASAGCSGLEVERRRHLPLLRALAHKARIATAAERERERIEQDRLAGPGLTGQHGEARRIVDVEPFDQDDVANREPGEHRTLLVIPERGRQPAGGIHNHEICGFGTPRVTSILTICVPTLAAVSQDDGRR